MSSVAKRMSRRVSSAVEESASAVSSAVSSSASSVCESLGMSCDGNEAVMWVVRAVLLVYASFVATNLPANVAWLFDNTVARLVMVVLILALAVTDPASAILLTIGFVLSIQAANKLHISKLANVAATSASDTETFMARAMDHLPVSKDEGVVEQEQVHLQNAPQTEQTDTPELALNENTNVFTTANQFDTVQRNTVRDNQDTEVRTWQNELGPQGLTEPAGFVFNDSGCSPAPVSQ